MMILVRVRPSSSRLTNTVWLRASTTRFFFGAASAGAASRAMAAITANAVAKNFNRMGSSPGVSIATQSSGLRFAAIERIARNCSAESLRKRPRSSGGAEFSQIRVVCRSSGAVVLRQVFGNRLGVAVVDRRAERLDHLGDRCAPARRVEERRVHRDIGEGVAGLAIGLYLVEAGPLFQLHVGRRRGKRDQCGDESDSEYPHGLLPQAVSVMFCMTLL